MDKIKLYKPITIDEKEVKEITPDFDSLPSNAIARAQTFLAQRQYPVMNPAGDVELHCLFCGMAAGIAMEDAYRLHPKDKLRWAEASVVFFNSDSEDSPESTTSEE
ncbi:MAG TPA: hypothetical protein VEG39_01785 [Clostridia bacterium]|nr:hypothetical protein [Clostridia bacterium]